MKATKIIFILNFVLCAIMLALDITYMFYIGGTPLKAVISCMFVAIGVMNAVCAFKAGDKGKYKIALPIALFVAMVGDVAINFNFIAGAAIFALGHVAYVAAYILTNGFKPTDIIYCACVFLPSALVITLAPIFDFGGVLMEIVCVVYALILSTMLGKALADAVRLRTLVAIIVAVGSVLFYVSDLALLIDKFAVIGKSARFAMRVMCLGTYYPAQFLLALSVFPFALSGLIESKNEKPTGDSEAVESGGGAGE